MDLWKLFGAGLFASALTVLVVRLLETDAGPRPLQSSQGEVDSSLRDEIASLRKALQSKAPMVLPPISTRSSDDSTVWPPELVEQLQAAMQGGSSGASVGVVARTPKNETLVQEVATSFLQDRRAVVEQYFCWTPVMIYRQFGMPDSAKATKSAETLWGYKSDGRGDLVFRFHNGVVIDVH